MNNKPTLIPKGRYRLKYRGTECLNCGQLLEMSDKFCPNCAQANSTKKLTLKDFFDEFFSSMISYDSKLLRTLSALLIRPGKITKDFINGKRTSYTNPFRFLLSLSIIYFLMINYGGNYTKFDRYGSTDDQGMVDNLGSLDFNFEGDKSVEAELDSLSKNQGLKEFFKETEKRDSLILSNPKNHFNTIHDNRFTGRLLQKQSFFKTVIRKDTIYEFADVEQKYGIPDNSENRMAFNIADGLLKLRQQPGSFLSTMISKLPFAIFFFLPVFSLFIWLVYVRKKYTYTDHLVFSFHITSLLFILLIISYLMEWIFNISVNWIFLIVFCIYLFIAMRKFYRQGIFKTTVKYIFLNSIFFILAIFATVALFAGNIFTF